MLFCANKRCFLIPMYILCTCQGESRISVLMTLSGPDTERPPLRGWIQGDCGAGGVKVWKRGRSVCPNMCVRQGKGKGWGGRGQIVHGAHPS